MTGVLAVINAAFRLAREADDACDDGVTSDRLRAALAAFWDAYKGLECQYRAKPDAAPQGDDIGGQEPPA